MADREFSHALLIEQVGEAEVRDRYGLSPQRLALWRRRGIPWTHRAHFADWASARLETAGVQLPPDFLTPPDLPLDAQQAA